MELEEIHKVLERYPNLTTLEVLISGITIGATTISPSIIFRFVSEAALALDKHTKPLFYQNLLKCNLGKAKDLLMTVKSSPPIIKRPSNPRQEPQYLCKLCRKPILEREINYLENCADLFHSGCLAKHIESEIKDNKFPVTCPVCSEEITSSEIERRTSTLCYQHYQKTEIEIAMGNKFNLVECPVGSCKQKFLLNELSKEICECPKCHIGICPGCMMQSHDTQTCEEARAAPARVMPCPVCSEPVAVKKREVVVCKCMNRFCSDCSKSPDHCRCNVKNP
jgi:hypothetical protein